MAPPGERDDPDIRPKNGWLAEFGVRALPAIDAEQAEVEIRGVTLREHGGPNLHAGPVVTTQEHEHGVLLGSARQRVPARQHITVRALRGGADGDDHARGAA